MLSLSSIYSDGEEQLYPGSDSSNSDYLDDHYDVKNLSVRNDNFYRSRANFEVSGFYSDEDEDDSKSLSPQPYLSTMQGGESACFSDHMRLSITDDVSPPTKTQTTRKRSLTNLFQARPESINCSNDSNSNSSPSHSNFHDTTLNQNTPDHFVDSFTIRQVDRSDNALPTHLRCEAPEIFLARPSYLSQARRKLLKKSIDRHITVGFQPRSTGLSAHEKNEYYQKIWIHRQNRMEAHQKMACNFELIPEEEESS